MLSTQCNNHLTDLSGVLDFLGKAESMKGNQPGNNIFLQSGAIAFVFKPFPGSFCGFNFYRLLQLYLSAKKMNQCMQISGCAYEWKIQGMQMHNYMMFGICRMIICRWITIVMFGKFSSLFCVYFFFVYECSPELSSLIFGMVCSSCSCADINACLSEGCCFLSITED